MPSQSPAPILTCYAIKHIPSGGFLPKRERKGHTHEEPQVGCIPRLFSSRKNANLALKAWLLGEWTEKIYADSYSGEYDVDMKIIDRPARLAVDMKIVPIVLKEQTE